MAYELLGDFLAELQDAGELVRIPVPVDSALELAEITDRICKIPGGGPALFFENVRGSTIPVVANLLGSRQRLCRALGVKSLDELSQRMLAFLQPELPDGWLGTLKRVPELAQRSMLPPRTVKTGLCQQVVKLGRDVNLWDFPVPRCWPDEINPLITQGQIYTRDPEGQSRGVGAFPLQLVDRTRLLPQWHHDHAACRHWRGARAARRQLPIAIALGGDPVFPLMASAGLPFPADPCLLGGFLRGSSIELVKCRTNDVEVPANAEIVIEGFIDADGPLELSAPAGCGTGYYLPPEELPVIQVSAVTHRANPVWPTQVYGRPPMEDYWLQLARERLLTPMLQLAAPEVVDCHAPAFGAGRNYLFVSIRKDIPYQARRVLNAVWSFGPIAQTKTTVIVDADVNVQRSEEVWYAAGVHVNPERDVVFSDGPMHPDDHALPIRGVGRRMGIDATRKLPEEGAARPWPAALRTSGEVSERVTQRWAEYGLRRGPGGLG